MKKFSIFNFQFSKFGFSLIEVIIALAVVLVTLIAFGVVVNTIPLTKTARNQNVAYHIAAKKVEELRHTAFVSLPASGPQSDPGLQNLASSTMSLTVGSYEGSSDIKQATVIVEWYENDKARNVNLTTLIGEAGLNQ